MQRAAAREEADPPVAADPLHPEDLDRTDLAGAPRVRAAAGRPVVPLDLDQPQEVLLRARVPAERVAIDLFAVDEVHADRPVGEDAVVGFDQDRLERAGSGFWPSQVDRRFLPAEVEADRGQLGAAHEGLRQDVLPGVLLEVVEARHRVDLSGHDAPRQERGRRLRVGGGDPVPDDAVLDADVEHLASGQAPAVARLSPDSA